MQIAAESASFVGNNNNHNQRKNGYSYNNPNENEKNDLKGKSLHKTYEKPKSTDRGRQRYNNEATIKYTSKPYNENQNIRSTEPNLPEIISGNRQERRQGNNLDRKTNFITNTETKETSQQINARNRSSTYTTARRFDTTRTTPYYTPTVPTIFNKVTQPAVPIYTRETVRKDREQLNEENHSKIPILSLSSNVKNTPSSTPNSLIPENTDKQLKYSSFKNYETTTANPILYETETTTTTPEFRTTMTESSKIRTSSLPPLIRDYTKTTIKNIEQGYDYSYRTTQTTFNPESLQTTTPGIFKIKT